MSERTQELLKFKKEVCQKYCGNFKTGKCLAFLYTIGDQWIFGGENPWPDGYDGPITKQLKIDNGESHFISGPVVISPNSCKSFRIRDNEDKKEEKMKQ